MRKTIRNKRKYYLSIIVGICIVYQTISINAMDNLKAYKQNYSVTLNVSSMYYEREPRYYVYQKTLVEFKKKYPYISINDEGGIPNQEWLSKILTSYAVGEEPDIVFFFSDHTAQYLVKDNLVVPVKEIREVYPDYANNINEFIFESPYEKSAAAYCVPLGGFYEGLFINKDLFEKNHIALPTDEDKFEKAIKTFKELGITPLAVDIETIPHYAIEHFLLAEGG